MLTEYQAHTLPQGQTPLPWLHRVLPRGRESFQHHVQRAQKLLSEKAFDPKTSLFITDERGPVGLSVVSGEHDKRSLDLLAIRGDRRRLGLGKQLLSKTLENIRKQSVLTLTASNISSANTAVVCLLTAAGFVGAPTGGIRMQRSLNDPLPAYCEPDGIEIRALNPGEEQAYVDLKNACFVGDGGRAWTCDDFHKEFTQSPIFDWSRMFVALENGQMIATATAWEANYDGPVGLIHWVGTRPECRGKGVGYTINLRALEELAALGYAEAYLNTARWRVPAVRLYERQGFSVHREMVNYTLVL